MADHDHCDCCRGMAALIASGILDTLETAPLPGTEAAIADATGPADAPAGDNAVAADPIDSDSSSRNPAPESAAR